MSTMKKRASSRGKKLLPGQMFDLPEFLTPVTEETVLEDFKMRHPTLSRQIERWEYRGSRVIRLWLTTGMVLDHSYTEHKAMIIKDGNED